MIADGSEEFCQRLKESLERVPGWEVTDLATDGLQAVERLQQSKPDVLVLDFMAAPPRVTLNGENSIQRCTRDSTFVGMALDVGENVFWYEAEAGDVNTMSVSIEYFDRYMGV